jgi:hypothetical protein
MKYMLVVGGWIQDGSTIRPWRDRVVTDDRKEVACVMADHAGKFVKGCKAAGNRKTDKLGEIWFEVWVIDDDSAHLEVAEGEFGW